MKQRALEATGQLYGHDEDISSAGGRIELADKLILDVRDWEASSGGLCGIGARVFLQLVQSYQERKIRFDRVQSACLSSMDPIQNLFQQYATIVLCQMDVQGIVAGRGSFAESFHCFGYDLKRRL